MPVDVEGDLDGGVAEHLGYGVEVRATVESYGGERVPEIVEADVRQSRRGEERLERAAVEVLAANGRARVESTMGEPSGEPVGVDLSEENPAGLTPSDVINYYYSLRIQGAAGAERVYELLNSSTQDQLGQEQLTALWARRLR